MTEEELIATIVRLPCPFDSPLKYEPTAFEQMLEQCGLDEISCRNSPDVKDWCSKNRNSRYIPEELLAFFGLRVSLNNY